MPVEEALNLTPSSPPTGTQALYVVMPNNPTGHCPTREQFAGITGYCARHRILLLADFCFRFYGSFWDYDQYQMLTDAGVDFICTEDTGKTWPAGDVKLGMLVASDRPYALLKDISDDFLFSVAPFTFEILTRLIAAEHRETRRVLAQDLADANREVLRTALDGSTAADRQPPASHGPELGPASPRLERDRPDGLAARRTRPPAAARRAVLLGRPPGGQPIRAHRAAARPGLLRRGGGQPPEAG